MSEKVSITKSKLDSLANAIAAIGGTSIPKTLSQMESAVLELTIPPNLETITIKPDNCVSSSTQITPETYICETDSSYPGTAISMSSQSYCNIGNYLDSNIKIELNKTYHCVGQLFIKWDDDDTEEYYYIDSNFTESSYAVISLNSFTWEGSTGATQTFGRMKLDMSVGNGYKTKMRPMTVGSRTTTKSGVLLPGSFYRITQVDINGYDTINLDFNGDPRFYEIYKSLAYRSVIASSSPGVSEWCNSLSTIEMWQFCAQKFSGNFVFNNVSSVGQYAFAVAWAGNGTSIYSPSYTVNFLRSSGTSLGQYTFCNNGMIKEINGPYISTIPQCFCQSCTSLTTISFPECTTISTNAFVSCRNLTTVPFPECTIIGISAFQSCNKLTTVSFSKCTDIGGYAFRFCTSLATISFPKCTTINGSAFQGCTNLTTVSFPECTTIENNAFSNCQKLESVYLMGSSIPTLGTGVFNSTPITVSTYLGYFGSIYVPSSLLASYKTVTNWATYSNRMVGI